MKNAVYVFQAFLLLSSCAHSDVRRSGGDCPTAVVKYEGAEQKGTPWGTFFFDKFEFLNLGPEKLRIYTDRVFGMPVIHAGSVELEEKEPGKWLTRASLVEVERPRTMEIIGSGEAWVFFHVGIQTAGSAEKGLFRLSITTREGCTYKSGPFGPAK